MAEQKELAVTPRTIMGKANKRLRKEGLIPANISGHNQEPQAVQVDAVAFDGLRRSRSARNIIKLTMADAPAQTVLIKRVQHAPTTGKVIHIDFSRVSLDERITSKVPLRFVGEALGVKNEGGVLLHLLDTLEVECPASDMVEAFDVDISSLTEIDSTLHASDVKLPANYTLITPVDEPIAKVAATRAALEAEAAETTTTATTEQAQPAGGSATEA